jgi:folate-dependent phosphoribosylglycinamide formyltransferase PurN
MNIRPTIEGLKAACVQAAEDEAFAREAVARARKALERAESALIGARENSRKAREALREFESSRYAPEITSREVDILAMQGYHAEVGAPLTDEIIRLIREGNCAAWLSGRKV